MKKGILLFISCIVSLVITYGAYSTYHKTLPSGNNLTTCINKSIELDCMSSCVMEQNQLSVETEDLSSYMLDINEGVELKEDETMIFTVKYINYLLKYSDLQDVSASEIISDLISK